MMIICLGLKEKTKPDVIVIPEGVKSIGEYTFAWYIGLISVTILNSVTSIGEFAFSGCNELKTVLFINRTLEEVRSMEHYPWNVSLEKISVQVD